MNLPIRPVLEAVRDGDGQWDTRTLDLTLGLRGIEVDHGILDDLRELERMGLIARATSAIGGTGPRWRITATGISYLADAPPAGA